MMDGRTMQRGSPILAERPEAADRAGFDRIYRDEHLAVERHLLYLTGDRQLAEDLTQETFGKLYERGLPDKDRAGETLRNPRAWLLKVASNLAYNHFRAEGRRAARETALEVTFETDETDRDDVLDVRRALERLELRDRTVLLLRHTGFSYAEIAEAIDIAPGSVGTILARAQRRFRHAYEGARPGADPKE
jgi:RNA polymerase sigma factor (sigma-70 family)